MIGLGNTVRAARLTLMGGALAASFGVAHAVWAQGSGAPVSRAVVQPLPDQSIADLNAALRKLSSDPQDPDALLQAGRASLKMGDASSATNFFTRADQTGATHGQAKIGLASTQIFNQRPVEALQLFGEAQREGAPVADFAGDYGLAYDLVGDNAQAQKYYRLALSRGNNDEIVRRLALSQAIAGDRNAAEATLLPLLQHQDLAAYRTRAFALAVLGKPEEAVDIADAVMPKSLAGRIAPYLRYMPRLTRAQQAAAGNFGHFPEASAIGQDDAAIAQYSGSARQVAAAPVDSRLVPAGVPLGSGKSQTKPAAISAPHKPEVAALASPPLAAAVAPAASQAAAPAMAKPTELASSPAPVASPVQSPKPAAPTQAPDRAIALANARSAASQGETRSFNLGDVSGSRAAAAAPAQPRTPPQAVAEPPKPVPAVERKSAHPAPPPAPESLTEIFAEFGNPQAPAQASPGAVDITRIKPARAAPPPEKADVADKGDKADGKAAAKGKADKADKLADADKSGKSDKSDRSEKKSKKAKPAKPEDPSRFWAQIATGRSKSALAFDWRRMTRDSEKLFRGKSPYVAKWGRTNRLVTGPFASEKQAEAFVEKLKKAGFDSFTFTSDEGQPVDPLPQD